MRIDDEIDYRSSQAPEIIYPLQPDLIFCVLVKLTMSVFNASRLLGKTVLVTGASVGIGAVRGPTNKVS
jgi:hypothetical protein